MFNRNRLLGLGLVAALGLGILAVPTQASAQIAKHRRNEKQHRTNAYALGAAGLILMGNKQETLGTVALAGAAYEAKRMQDEIDARHRQYGSRNGYYDNNGRWRTGSSQSNRGYYDRNGRWHSGTSSNTSGYYDSNGRWHSYNSGSTNGYYDRNGTWHSGSYNDSRDGYYDSNGRWHSYNSNDRYNDRYDRDRRNDDCDDDRYDRDRRDDRRGREWAASRGNKKGWDKNGKRRRN